MDYFILTSQEGNPIPRIVNWYGKIDVGKLNRKEYKELPRYFLLDMETGMDILYPDILTEPLFMVSREAMEVIGRYEEEIPFFYIALFDTKNEESASYYCPILDDRETSAIYRVRKTDGDEIRIRLDLAESLLYRGASGLELNIQKQKEKSHGTVAGGQPFLDIGIPL